MTVPLISVHSPDVVPDVMAILDDGEKYITKGKVLARIFDAPEPDSPLDAPDFPGPNGKPLDLRLNWSAIGRELLANRVVTVLVGKAAFPGGMERDEPPTDMRDARRCIHLRRGDPVGLYAPEGASDLILRAAVERDAAIARGTVEGKLHRMEVCYSAGLLTMEAVEELFGSIVAPATQRVQTLRRPSH